MGEGSEIRPGSQSTDTPEPEPLKPAAAKREATKPVGKVGRRPSKRAAQGTTEAGYGQLDKERKAFIEREFKPPVEPLANEELNKLEAAYVQHCAAKDHEAQAKRAYERGESDVGFSHRDRARALRSYEDAILEEIAAFRRHSLG